jgi:hypothetical protein
MLLGDVSGGGGGGERGGGGGAPAEGHFDIGDGPVNLSMSTATSRATEIKQIHAGARRLRPRKTAGEGEGLRNISPMVVDGLYPDIESNVHRVRVVLSQFLRRNLKHRCVLRSEWPSVRVSPGNRS